MQKIIPNLWFNKNAEEAGEFYASVFPKTTTSVEARYPETDLLDFQKDFAGLPRGRRGDRRLPVHSHQRG